MVEVEKETKRGVRGVKKGDTERGRGNRRRCEGD